MNYYTNKYREITTLTNVPYNVSIIHDNNNRWICYCNKGQIRKDLYGFTLIDNFQEHFIFMIKDGDVIQKPENNNKNIKIIPANENHPVTIICYSTPTNILPLPLPDFAIDVLQTVDTNISFEIIRRITVAFHEKTEEMKPRSRQQKLNIIKNT